MGGRVAEELLFHEVTGGASNDFEKATSIATTMVLRFGMGRDPEAADEGATGRGILTTLVGDSAGFSRDVRDAQARAIGSILDEAYTGARRTLIAEMPRLRDVAAFLYEQERIDGNEFEAVMAGRLRPADADGWRAAAAAPRPWAAIPTTFQERSPRIRAMPSHGRRDSRVACRAAPRPDRPGGLSHACRTGRTPWPTATPVAGASPAAGAPMQRGALGRPRRGRRLATAPAAGRPPDPQARCNMGLGGVGADRSDEDDGNSTEAHAGKRTLATGTGALHPTRRPGHLRRPGRRRPSVRRPAPVAKHAKPGQGDRGDRRAARPALEPGPAGSAVHVSCWTGAAGAGLPAAGLL